ncbi:hypothetical protein [Jannaschia sp. W003]|uniref:hypothetical protein n=1 Tax=Jannaschia sp. W003 TaxID=2867012 RepID=UPI0021A4FCD2|nr:hypothetical protein [Jannaschia sp. W003]UWQ20146.1 hypothetical protein K3554_09015 [Jannaschia sp. W003]
MDEARLDVVRTAADWARAEMLSSAVFALAGAAFLLAAFGFWQVGRTEMARAYVVPMIVAGALLLVLGVGLVLSGRARLAGFPAAHAADAASAIAAEIALAHRALNSYRVAVFRVFPVVVAVCALLIPLLSGPNWRASLVTAIAAVVVAMLVDTNANARLETYRAQLADSLSGAAGRGG